jgi:hypothetical protein
MVRGGKVATADISIRGGYRAKRRIQGALDKVEIPQGAVERHPANI